MELPAGLDDEPEKVRIFRPYVELFALTNVQSGSRKVVGAFDFNETNTISSFIFANP